MTTTDPEPFWTHAHGALVHFPIALVCAAGVLEAAGFALRSRDCMRSLREAAHWTMLLGAAGSVPAVASGLFLTRGRMWGHGALRLHHLFVWPSFGLVVGLAVWRTALGARASDGNRAGYLAVLAVAIVLITFAGYWGGVLLSRP
ncbi:MAG TPA: DUF2231 domain-containing protein [Opitutaceae bacterium]|jgi:uncharacterized membrane protein|nr:DUF2231 domain-containing protein [Opitutaceae bacterium]